MIWRVRPSTIAGTIAVPGDKSIAHRALMLGGIAREPSRIDNLPRGEDVLSTVRCLRGLGVKIEMADGVVSAEPPSRLTPPTEPLDAGNSGTTMRLLSGIIAGQKYFATLTGDASLSRRPMNRIVEPLMAMGAQIRSQNGHPPLCIEGGNLRGIRYELPVPSAQVKSAILLAGLFADGKTAVVESIQTRDHTERLLRALGVDVEMRDGNVAVQGLQTPNAFELRVPGDFSSAAFFFAAAALMDGEITVRDVGINPTRSRFLSVLKRMGAQIRVTDEREELGEPVADVRVGGSVHTPIEIGADEVPLLIDELPLLALLATQSEGSSVVRGAQELRVKETDRIAATVEALRLLGADAEELPDGFVVRGPTVLNGAAVQSRGDHRLAMMEAVAGTIARGGTVIEGAEAAGVSFPEFETVFAAAGGQIDAA